MFPWLQLVRGMTANKKGFGVLLSTSFPTFGICSFLWWTSSPLLLFYLWQGPHSISIILLNKNIIIVFSSKLGQEILIEKSSSVIEVKLENILDLVSFYNQIISGLSLLLLARFITDTLNITIGTYCALKYSGHWIRTTLETCSSLGFFFNLLNFVINLDRLYEDIQSLSTHLLDVEYHSVDAAFIRYYLILDLTTPCTSKPLFRRSEIVRGRIGKLDPATGNGYFYINKMSFTGLVSVCVTYLVIMLQFE